MATWQSIGMRVKVPNGGWVVNTCAMNDTEAAGDDAHWAWCNPTNRAILHEYADVEAVSVECLWQGTKIRAPGGVPNPDVLNGNWRAGKGRRPIGAWAGAGMPLITSPGEARRAIYLPAYWRLLKHWVVNSPQVANLIMRASEYPGTVYLRDHDTGQGVDRNGPMSHAWLLSTWQDNLYGLAVNR